MCSNFWLYRYGKRTKYETGFILRTFHIVVTLSYIPDVWPARVEWFITEEALLLILIDDCICIESFVDGFDKSAVSVDVLNAVVLVLLLDVRSSVLFTPTLAVDTLGETLLVLPLVVCSSVFITPTLAVDTLGETLLVLPLIVCSSVFITPTLLIDTVGETLLVVEVLPRWAKLLVNKSGEFVVDVTDEELSVNGSDKGEWLVVLKNDGRIFLLTGSALCFELYAWLFVCLAWSKFVYVIGFPDVLLSSLSNDWVDVAVENLATPEMETRYFSFTIKLLLAKLLVKYVLRPDFFISWFTNPPTVIFQKVEKKKYFRNYFFILSADSKYYLLSLKK